MRAEDLVLTSRADPSACTSAVALEHASSAPLGFLNYTTAHQQHYDAVVAAHPQLQLCLSAPGKGVVASACLAPLYWEGSLPNKGWDAMLERSAEERRPNTLCGLTISVSRAYRRMGIARRLISEIKNLAASEGLHLVFPVRPAGKALFPCVDMRDYVALRTSDGRRCDPWVRSHEESGGRVVGICSQSMTVCQPLSFWESWVGVPLDGQSSFLVEGGLTPVIVDPHSGRGVYTEPNVWVIYP